MFVELRARATHVCYATLRFPHLCHTTHTFVACPLSIVHTSRYHTNFGRWLANLFINGQGLSYIIVFSFFTPTHAFDSILIDRVSCQFWKILVDFINTVSSERTPIGMRGGAKCGQSRTRDFIKILKIHCSLTEDRKNTINQFADQHLIW